MKEKENVLDVLMYLFENYIDEEGEQVQADRETLVVELEAAGFPDGQIRKAFDWLEGLTAEQPEAMKVLSEGASLRLFTEEETARLDRECRGYILYLEQAGILQPNQRELIIDRIMALEAGRIDLDQVKWIILMVLFNQPGQEEAFSRMEDLVFEDSVGMLH